MEDEREPQSNAIINNHFQQTVNDRLANYEKQIDDSFDFLLTRLKHTDNTPLSIGDGDCKIDEFSLARRKEFFKKVNSVREIIHNDFRNDITKIISSKYSNINTPERDLTSKLLDDMVEHFKELQLTDSSVYSEVIDLFENLKISDKEANPDVIDLLEKLPMFRTKSPTRDEFSETRNDESEEDVTEVVQNVDMIDLSSDDDDLIREGEVQRIIQVILDTLSDGTKSVSDESVSEVSFTSDEAEVTVTKRETPKALIQKLNLPMEFSPKTFANNRKRAAIEFTNFMVDRRLITIESRPSEDELEDMYDLYRTEFNPEVSIADQVLPVLQSNNIVKKDINNNKVEFNEIIFLDRIHDSLVHLNELVPFKGQIIRMLNSGYLTRFAIFRCPVCKDCFQSKEKLDDHNTSEMHILKTIYLKDRSWFVRDVDYLQITGIPDRKLELGETGTNEISFVNVSQDANKIYIWKIFELVNCGESIKMEYGSNYRLEKGDSFKINMTVKFTSILSSETLYPIVLKLSQNDTSEYNFILIEPHFKTIKTARKVNYALMNLKNYRPPLHTAQNNNNDKNKRHIIPESSEPGQRMISDAFSAFHSNRRNVAMANWRIQNETPTYDKKVPDDLEIKEKVEMLQANWRMQNKIPTYDKKVPDHVEIKEKVKMLQAPRIARAIKIPKLRLPDNHVPAVLQVLLNFKFKTTTFHSSPLEKGVLKNIRKLMCEESTLKVLHNKDVLTEHNYIERLRFEMWVEEYQAIEEIRSFGQKDIDLLTDRLNENLIGISLPGLSEGRPSLLKGDSIIIKSKSPNFPAGVKKCEGIVQLVQDKAAYVKLHKTFYTEQYWTYKADVEFRFNRTPLKMSHTVLETLRGFKWQQSLFPQMFDMNPNDMQLKPFFNESVANNELQIQAVTNIVQNKAFPAPYILFGPPGTGKTATVVEAITQIWSMTETSRICVCASSNTAADVIAKRLLQYIPLSDVIRIYGLSRNDAEIISELQGCCNYDAKVKEVFFPCFTELKTKRIVVMTPVTAGRYILNGITFDYIFMDEAGHALEVDVLIPLSGFLRSTQCSMVLAGDPKQLGPVVRSPYAMALGYGMSLMERLMTQCEIYKKDPVTGKYNPKVITKLVNNYRSHDVILRIPNQQFYDNELEAKASPAVTSSLCQWNKLPAKGFPIIFHSVKGFEQKENNSPSYFNSEEIDVVQDYVLKLFNSRGIQIDQSEVGIISPYRKQVHKIRQRLQSWPKISVASVEEFQGQERKVIIISTVRSRHELIATDYKYGLGFLKNEKRFNVAITRAIALLIVIGNPDILQCDPHWREFLRYCSENSAFVGEPAEGTLPEDFDPSVNQDLYLNGFQF